MGGGWRLLCSVAGLAAALATTGCQPAVHLPARIPAYQSEESIAIGPMPAGATTPTVVVAAKEPSVTLPDAIQACVFANLKIQVAKENVQIAHADLLTSSIIPNPTLFVDGQLFPLQPVNINNQAGPPQYDAQLTIPIDWWLYGKRLAAIEASRWNIDVANAETADLLRRQTAATVEAFYDVLESKALLKLSEEALLDMQRFEDIIKKQVELGGAGTIELDRVRLAVLDSRRDLRLKQENASVAKTKLRNLMGRSRPDDDFDVSGTLQVTAVAPPPTLDEAYELAQQHRPDLKSDRFAVSHAQAAVERERRAARPHVAVIPGYSYQDQIAVTGFRNASMWSVALTTTLPLTDRNQGGIARAESAVRQTQLALLSSQADIRAEIETVLAGYRRALENIQRDDPQAVQSARNLREKTEAAYKVGGRKLLEVLDAQRAYRERVQASISSQADYWRSLSRLNAAIGLRAIEPTNPIAGPDGKKDDAKQKAP